MTLKIQTTTYQQKKRMTLVIRFCFVAGGGFEPPTSGL